MIELEDLVEVTVTLVKQTLVVCPGCDEAYGIDPEDWSKARSGAQKWPSLASQLGIHCPECEEFGKINDWKEASER